MGSKQPPADYRACPHKHLTRQRSLDIARLSPALWNKQHNRLGVSWIEITGVEDPTLQMLLDEDVFPAKGVRYIGVNGPLPHDTEKARQAAGAVLKGNKDTFPEETAAGLCQWRYGILGHLLQDEPESFRDVGVIVADSSWTISSADTILQHASTIKFAKEQAAHLGECLLMINAAFRGSPGNKLTKAQSRWLDTLAAQCEVDPITSTATFTYRNKGSRVTMFPVWLLLR